MSLNIIAVRSKETDMLWTMMKQHRMDRATIGLSRRTSEVMVNVEQEMKISAP